ncbi:MAG: presenilin family intramembrane aspartyl protease PSH [Candidatus Poseidoniaceae archaeon]
MSDVAGDFRRQLPSMIGMAGMFVATIFLAMYIRPWYDKAGLQAFGEAGASQLRYIGLELLMIFIFTAAILLLAKYKKEWVIKYGIMGILFIALLYASIPLAHQILVDDSVTPFEYESTKETEATYLTEIGMDQYLDTIRSNQSGELVNTIRLMQWGVEEPIWSTDILHGNVSYEFSELIVVPGPDWVTINTGAVINTLSLTDGSIVSTYDCFYYDNQGDLRPLVEVGCILATEIEDALYIVDAGERLHRFNIDRENYPNQLTRQQKQATWQLPSDMKAVDVLVEAELLSDTSLLIVSEEYAGVVRLNQTAGFPEGGIYEPAHILIEASSEAGFTSADVGYSNLLKIPMNESTTGEQLIVLGTADGDIHSWSFEPAASTDNPNTYSPDLLQKESGGSIEGFASEIRDVRLTDYDNTGFTELLVTTGDDARLLWSSTLIQKLIVDVPKGEDVVVAFGMTQQDAEKDTNHLHATVINGTYVTSSGVVEESMELVGGLVIEDIPTIIGLLVSLLLMILLYVHSEWYVVNTVGILVGSGVIVMLGVSFVPTLIMVFMIAAAVYDAWAVYKSKHMLDLADTMMNLNLPILLVAPQDSDYTMRTERTTVHDAPDETPRDTVQEVPRERVVAKSNDAMLMGLGDVIFPGMLVLSTLQYVGGDNGFIMAMTTLVGSLIGYSVLMYFVGKGQAQAGLPLLNGGAILGYIVGGLLTIGMAMFQFNISF